MRKSLLLLTVACAAVMVATAAAVDGAGAEKTGAPDDTNITRPMEFPLDHSKITVVSDTLIDVLGISTACVRCDRQLLLAGIDPLVEAVLPPIDCRWPYDLEVVNGLWATSMKNLTLNCGDRAVYVLTVAHSATNGTLEVSLERVLEPLNTWLPLVIAGAVLAIGAVAAYAAAAVHGALERRRRRRAPPQFAPIGDEEADIDPLLRPSHSPMSSQQSLSGSAVSKLPPRVNSLDAFRGCVIALMIFVNHGGGGFWYMEHAAWNGLHVADLVFPWFVWIMGSSLALSLKSGTLRTGKLLFLQKALVRFAELFLIGLFLNNGFDLGSWRIMGVLQRLAISYFVVALIGAFMPKLCARPKSTVPTIQDGRELLGGFSPLRDIGPYVLEYAVVAALAVAHTLVTFLVSVPGCGRGYLGPGGLGDHGRFANCTGGITGYIDRLVFTDDHVYQWPTTLDLYNAPLFEPEGLLGCLTSIVLCYLGLQAGRTLVHFSRHSERLLRWAIWGVALTGVGVALCFARQEGGPIPLNKNLWSLSFVFLLAGLGFIALSICYLLVDVLGAWNGHPFKVVGMNSIAIYVLAEVFGGFFPFDFKVPQATHGWYLTSSLVCVGCWIVIAYWFFFKKVFIKLG